MRFFANAPLLLLLGTDLADAFRPQRHSGCDAGSCRSGYSCQALGRHETCCPPRHGYPEHICGHEKECCGIGCCPEGWQCGANNKCYPPNATPSLQDDCLTTILTVVKRGHMYPRVDEVTSNTPAEHPTDTTTPGQDTVPSTLTTEPLSTLTTQTLSTEENTPTSKIESTEVTDSTTTTVEQTPTSTTALSTITIISETDRTPTGPGTTTESETLSTTTATTSDTIITETESQTTTIAHETSTIANKPTGTVTTEPDGQVTTVPPATTTTSDYAGFIFPITTSVSDPQPTDDGFVIPCGFWFFNACIGGIFGWHITIPPGIHPPGPPPSFKIDPEFPIKININGNLPDWPKFTVGPDNVPTFSEEPTECETETAEMCVTSTSYGVSIDNGVTSTTASQVTSSCGTVYGCDVDDSATSVTAATTTTGAATATMIIVEWEQWEDFDESDAVLQDASDQAQSRIDADFGISDTPSATPSATTTELTSTLTTEDVSTTTEISTTRVNTPTTTEVNTPTATEITTSTAEPTTLTTEIISTTELTTTSAVVEPPTTTAVEEPPTTTAVEEPTPNASLVRGPVICHNEADFPGHADINGGTQDDFSTDFSGKLGSDGTTMSPTSGPIVWNTQDKHGINYWFSASWVDGCITTVPTQDFQFPLGLGGIMTAYLMVREDYTKCNNGGVGGSCQVGCILYEFTGGK